MVQFLISLSQMVHYKYDQLLEVVELKYLNVCALGTPLVNRVTKNTMGSRDNLVNGRGLKVNTAKHSSEKGEGGTHPPLSHYSA